MYSPIISPSDSAILMQEGLVPHSLGRRQERVKRLIGLSQVCVAILGLFHCQRYVGLLVEVQHVLSTRSHVSDTHTHVVVPSSCPLSLSQILLLAADACMSALRVFDARGRYYYRYYRSTVEIAITAHKTENMTIIIDDAKGRLATSRGSSSSTSSTNKYREPLNPIPILDRKLLLQSLPEDVHSVLKPNHLDIFYQALHRANYPDLKDFISNLLLSYSAPSKVITKLPNLFLLHVLRNCQREHPSDNQCDYYYTTITSRIVNLLDSVDKSTTKLAIQLQDNHVVEAVIMRHCSGNFDNKHQHVTLCVSSQVGCAMKCVFCATGKHCSHQMIES